MQCRRLDSYCKLILPTYVHTSRLSAGHSPSLSSGWLLTGGVTGVSAMGGGVGVCGPGVGGIGLVGASTGWLDGESLSLGLGGGLLSS